MPPGETHDAATANRSPLRILIVSQMYPGPDNPDLGVFVQSMHRALEQRGHSVRVVAVTRRGGGILKHLSFCVRAVWSVLRQRPDVVYAHFLAPAGACAALGALLVRRPLVVTAHGRDVRNITAMRGMRTVTRFVVRRASAVVAVSEYLRDELLAAFPQASDTTHVINSGIDMELFHPADAAAARAAVGWGTQSPAFVFVGTLDERKNVQRLVAAFTALGTGSLALVGDGPLRAELAGIDGVHLVGRVTHAEVANWIAASDVLCLPSTVEPFGQVLLEAMACERSVLATQIGGPPEFVPPDAGVLVDPFSVDAIRTGMQRAAALPSPNTQARHAAAQHDIHLQAAKVEALLLAAVASR